MEEEKFVYSWVWSLDHTLSSHLGTHTTSLEGNPKIDTIDKSILSNFNPPLIDPFGPLL